MDGWGFAGAMFFCLVFFMFGIMLDDKGSDNALKARAQMCAGANALFVIGTDGTKACVRPTP